MTGRAAAATHAILHLQGAQRAEGRRDKKGREGAGKRGGGGEQAELAETVE